MEAIHFNRRGMDVFGGPPLFKKKKKSHAVQAGSMNFHVRKIENERIYEENQRLFCKLKESKPHLPKNEHDVHFAKHRKVLQSLSKESQLKFLAAMSFAGISGSPQMGRSPSMIGLTSDRSKT